VRRSRAPAAGLALLLALLAAPALAFDPKTDRPSSEYGATVGAPGRSSPINVAAASRVTPTTVARGEAATFVACYRRAPDQSIGKLWQQWQDDASGEWFYLYATNVAAAGAAEPLFELHHYNQVRRATRLAEGLVANETHLGRDLASGRLYRGPGATTPAFEVMDVSIRAPDPECPAEPGRQAISFGVTLRWIHDASAWEPTNVTLVQAIESRDDSASGRPGVFYDGWQSMRGGRGQLSLAKPIVPPTETPVVLPSASDFTPRSRWPHPLRLLPLGLATIAIGGYALRSPR
jgi:hypothetical protein